MKKHILFILITSLTIHATDRGQPKNDESVMTPEQLNIAIQKITSSKPYEKILFKDKNDAIWLPVSFKEANGTSLRKWVQFHKDSALYRTADTDPNDPDSTLLRTKDIIQKLPKKPFFYLPSPNNARFRLAKYLTLTFGGAAGVWTLFKKQKEKLTNLEAQLKNESDNQSLIAEHTKQKNLVRRIKVAAIIASTAGALFFLYQEPWYHKGFEKHNGTREWISPEAYLSATSPLQFEELKK